MALLRNDVQQWDSRHAVFRNQQVSGSSPLAGSTLTHFFTAGYMALAA